MSWSLMGVIGLRAKSFDQYNRQHVIKKLRELWQPPGSSEIPVLCQKCYSLVGDSVNLRTQEKLTMIMNLMHLL